MPLHVGQYGLEHEQEATQEQQNPAEDSVLFMREYHCFSSFEMLFGYFFSNAFLSSSASLPS